MVSRYLAFGFEKEKVQIRNIYELLSLWEFQQTDCKQMSEIDGEFTEQAVATLKEKRHEYTY